MKRYGLICALAVTLAALLAIPAFSQEAEKATAQAPEATATVAQEETPVATEAAAPAATAVTEEAMSTAPAVTEMVAPAAPAEAAPMPAPETAQSKDISIYGEVLTVNAAANTMSVQYYDYDNDEEKTVELSLSADTKLENAASLNEVKKGDWVDAVYTSSEGKSVAKSVMVEREEIGAEEVPEGAAPAAETMPAE